MKQSFAVIVLGGTGQVGGAAVAELLATSECRELVMVTRKHSASRSRVRKVVLDTRAADFAERIAALAREVLSQGPVSAVSCVGVGSGSMRWSEEELQRLELGVVGALRVAAMPPVSPSFTYFLRQERNQPTIVKKDGPARCCQPIRSNAIHLMKSLCAHSKKGGK